MRRREEEEEEGVFDWIEVVTCRNPYKRIRSHEK